MNAALDVAGDPILSVSDLVVGFRTEDGPVEAVRGIAFDVARGECLGVVGESGSGKSQSFLAILGLLTSNGHASGRAMHGGRNLLELSPAELRRVRGGRIGMIFQDPLTSLTPHMTIAAQMRETLVAHGGAHGERAPSRKAVRARSLEWLERVHLTQASRRLDQYPHELSGGMRQRVMIAMTMLAGPELLIADEPTTALDVTVQAGILDLMRELQDEHGTSIVLVTHDMGVVAGLCDRVQVMSDGRVVESGTADETFHAPREPYTRRLLAAVPRMDAPTREPLPRAEPLLRVDDLCVDFTLPSSLFAKRERFRAVDEVSLTLGAGETLGVVGESGSGKSTLARAVLRLIEPTAGRVAWLGRSFGDLDAKALRAARRDLQIVFQDPFASLDPAMPVVESIGEPLRVFEPTLDRRGRRARAIEALERVGLDGSFANRYPHELSGGQNQRVGIARATIAKPKLLVCDEAVSALDVSVQARVLALLANLQEELGLAMLFITHDLAVVSAVAHRVLVLYRGRVVETAPTGALFAGARHPYTRRLIGAVPVADPRAARAAKGDAPEPTDDAKASRGSLVEVAPGHFVASGGS